MPLRQPLRPIAVLAAAALVALLVAGCGSSSKSSTTSTTAAGNGVADKSPEQILAAAKAAAASASSVHVAGKITTGGNTVQLNLALASDKGGKGTVSQNGTTFGLVVTGGSVYIKGSAAFYRQIGGKAAVQLFGGKWLKAPASGQYASISQLTDLQTIIGKTLQPTGTITKSGIRTIGGRPAVALTDKSKGGVLYVATTGKPYPLAIGKVAGSGGDASGSGRLVYDRWNAPVTLKAPPNAIDVAQLKSQTNG